MRRHRCMAVCLAALAAVGVGYQASAQVVLYSEDFEGLTLGDSVNELVGTNYTTTEESTPGTSALPGVWSATATGWTVDNDLSTYDGGPTVTGVGTPGQGLADYGVDEWEGWGFARLDFWSEKDDQDRGMFGDATGASGTAAIVDPDEYFDLGSQNDPVNGGYLSSSLSSPAIPVVAQQFYGLGFDSSWRAEAFDDSALGDTFVDQNNQSVEIIATFDVGPSVQITKWNSDSSDLTFFKADAPDENFAPNGADIPAIEVPAGATEMTLHFNLANGANDWWWAVDNIEVAGLTGADAGNTVFSEDFEASVTLGDSVNERLGDSKITGAPGSSTTVLGDSFPTSPVADAFTHTPPTGMTVTTTLDAGNEGDNNQGVFEWEQWSFATREFWNFADTQGRENFTKGTGVIAIADGDEWTDSNTDLGMTDETGKLDTLLETPNIDISGVALGNQVQLSFDSSYDFEDGQDITVSAILDDDDQNPVVLLTRSGDGDGMDYTNESLSFLLDPQGASTVRFAFSYVGGNNWWWAIDNINVAGVPEPSSVMMVGLALVGGAVAIRRRS